MCLCLEKYRIDSRQIIGFGSNGAAVMTGHKGGVGVLFKKQFNKYIESVHCIAHRLALVMSQAADKQNVPYLGKFQELMTSLYKYLKHSSTRVSSTFSEKGDQLENHDLIFIF